MTMKEPLLGKTLDELREVAASVGLPPFTAKQIADWLYKKHIHSIDEMSNISLKGRAALAAHYDIGCVPPVRAAQSADGTRKYLFPAAHGLIETVYIPETDRATLCVSCQVGCRMGCHFCMTGQQGWSGNLTTAEILNQIYSIDERDSLTNIVFMGMGEPFDNTDCILRATTALTAQWGYAWSPRRITVSSVGLLPGLRRFIAASECHLAISLHNPFPDERAAMMPAERAYSITDIISELRLHDWSHQRRISFEYTMFEGSNDTRRHAAGIVRLLRGLECRVNLIRFHSIPGIALHSPSQEKMEQFRDYLSDNGITCTIRRSRGEDISAACGLLSSTQINLGNR